LVGEVDDDAIEQLPPALQIGGSGHAGSR